MVNFCFLFYFFYFFFYIVVHFLPLPHSKVYIHIIFPSISHLIQYSLGSKYSILVIILFCKLFSSFESFFALSSSAKELFIYGNLFLISCSKSLILWSFSKETYVFLYLKFTSNFLIKSISDPKF